MAIGIFEDGAVTDRERERYLRAAYETLPPIPEFPRPEQTNWGNDIAEIFRSLYNPVVAERFRQPYIDRVRLARDFFYKRDFHAPAARQGVLLSLCNNCVGGQAKAIANFCCVATSEPISVGLYAYRNPITPQPQFGFVPNVSDAFEKEEDEFNSIVRGGNTSELERFRDRWKADKGNAEMKYLWLDDERIAFLQNVRKEMFVLGASPWPDPHRTAMSLVSDYCRIV